MTSFMGRQPLYEQLANMLRYRIENEMDPDDPLPSERELSDSYGLSRTTVRLALQELEHMGLIYRQRGRGTFVADVSERATDLMGGYSFTDQQRQLGRVPKTTILEFDSIEANKFLAQHMHVILGEKLFRIKRLRSADNVPMMLEVTYLPVSQFFSLTAHDVEQKSLYQIFEEDYNVKIGVAEEEFKASIARSDDATLLQISEGSPVLSLTRTTFNDRNIIVEFTLSVARADQFRYKIVHTRS